MDTALILSFLGANLLAVLTLVIKVYRSGGVSASTNGQKKIDNGLQRQVDAGGVDTKILSDRFGEQVTECNARWLDAAEFRGELKSFMGTILERLPRSKTRQPR